MTDNEARAVPVGWALLDNGEAEPIDRSGRAVPVGPLTAADIGGIEADLINAGHDATTIDIVHAALAPPVPAVGDRERLAALLDDVKRFRPDEADPTGSWLLDTEATADALLRAGVSLTGSGLREAAESSLDLLTDLSVAFHNVGSIRDHADPQDRTGWNVHGIETCDDTYCVDALATIAALRAVLSGESGEPKEPTP